MRIWTCQTHRTRRAYFPISRSPVWQLDSHATTRWVTVRNRALLLEAGDGPADIRKRTGVELPSRFAGRGHANAVEFTIGVVAIDPPLIASVRVVVADRRFAEQTPVATEREDHRRDNSTGADGAARPGRVDAFPGH